MNRYLGRVISPSTPQRVTVVSSVWRPERYVAIGGEFDGKPVKLIGRIESVEAVNPFFATPDRIDFVDEKNSTDTRYAKYMYSVSILGAITEGRFDDSCRLPPPPGGIVEIAAPLDLEAISSLPGGDLTLGALTGVRDSPVRMPSESIWKNHTCVIGRTGAGKSHLVRWLIRGLKGDGFIVLFSPSSEYREVASKLRSPNSYRDADTITLRFTMSDLTYALGLTSQEVGAVRVVLFGGRADSRQADLWSQSQERTPGTSKNVNRGIQSVLSAEEVASRLEDSGLEPARSVAQRLRYSGLRFSSEDGIVGQLVRGLNVFDLSGFDERASQFVMMRVLTRLFEQQRIRYGIPEFPVLIFVEEAHNFIPSTHGALSKAICARIAREGRKLRMSLVIISQRPRQLDPTVTSQARNIFLFQLPNPDDIVHVLGHTPVFDEALPSALRQLGERECVASMASGHRIAFTVSRWTE